MSLKPKRFAVGMVALLALVSGCTKSDSNPNVEVTSAPPAANGSNTTQDDSAAPMANLSGLSVYTIMEAPPKTLPEWKPGDNVEEYGKQTLLFLTEAGRKTGAKVRPFSYAIYNGSPNERVSCGGEYNLPSTGGAFAVTYCPALNGNKGVFILMPESSNWQNGDTWGEEPAPLRHFVMTMSEHIAWGYHSNLRKAPEGYICLEGQLYSGITALQPALTPTVSAYLAAHDQYTMWRNDGYKTGNKFGCKDTLMAAASKYPPNN